MLMTNSDLELTLNNQALKRWSLINLQVRSEVDSHQYGPRRHSLHDGIRSINLIIGAHWCLLLALMAMVISLWILIMHICGCRADYGLVRDVYPTPIWSRVRHLEVVALFNSIIAENEYLMVIKLGVPVEQRPQQWLPYNDQLSSHRVGQMVVSYI